MFAVLEDGDYHRIMVTGTFDVAELLELADMIDLMMAPGARVVVDLGPSDQTLLAMATLARCRQRAEPTGGTVAVEPPPRGEAARMWRLGLREFLGLLPGSEALDG